MGRKPKLGGYRVGSAIDRLKMDYTIIGNALVASLDEIAAGDSIAAALRIQEALGTLINTNSSIDEIAEIHRANSKRKS